MGGSSAETMVRFLFLAVCLATFLSASANENAFREDPEMILAEVGSSMGSGSDSSTGDDSGSSSTSMGDDSGSSSTSTGDDSGSSSTSMSMGDDSESMLVDVDAVVPEYDEVVLAEVGASGSGSGMSMDSGSGSGMT